MDVDATSSSVNTDSEADDESSDNEQGPSHVMTRCRNPQKRRRSKNSSKVRCKSLKYVGTKRIKRGPLKTPREQPPSDDDSDTHSNTNQIQNEGMDCENTVPLYKSDSEGEEYDINLLLETIDFDNYANLESTKTWQERGIIRQNNYENVRLKLHESVIAKYILTQTACEMCHVRMFLLKAVLCDSCNKELCYHCDFKIHSTNPFHNRFLVTNESNEPLKNNEFFDKDWKELHHDVCLPCRLPKSCEKCGKDSKYLRLTPSTYDIVIVNQKGRFDVKAVNYQCTQCSSVREARLMDYVSSGFWPGDCISLKYFFSKDLFIDWFHDQHLSIGKSQNKFIQRLQNVSKEFGRCGSIDKALFNQAYREWEYFRHCIKIQILMRNQMSCPACGDSPTMGSSDGNMKCTRRKCAGSARKKINTIPCSERPPLYASEAIQSDVTVEQHRSHIYSKIKRSKQKEMCGGAVFQAAKLDSGRKKNYDETGLVVSSCRHGIVLGALNLFHGETFTHTHFMHYMCWQLNCKFFCYDVACRYWPFAKDVGDKFPQFKAMTENMGCMIPIMHVKVHGLSCQVEWNPHWKKGVGLTIGEEHEQVFSRLSLYGYKTRQMTKSNRIDHLSAGIFYIQWLKVEQMAGYLKRRLLKARKLIPQFLKILNHLLEEHEISFECLPQIHEMLLSTAIASSGTFLKDSSLEKLRTTLEGVYVELKNVQVSISTQAEHSKARTKLRIKLRKLNIKSRKLIVEINSKSTEDFVSQSDFENGHFPWHQMMKTNDTSSFNLPINIKYKLVDIWMRWERAKEEIILAKQEMRNYLHYLGTKKKELLQHINIAPSSDFERGKIAVIKSEIARITAKIEEALVEWNVSNMTDFRAFFSKAEEEEDSFTRSSDSEEDQSSNEEDESSDEEVEGSNEEEESSTEGSSDEVEDIDDTERRTHDDDEVNLSSSLDKSYH